MNWINPSPGLWYITEPIVVTICLTSNQYAIITADEIQYANTIELAQQMAYDMALAKTQVSLPVVLRPFSLDLPTNNQTIYVMNSTNQLSTGIWSSSNNSVILIDGTVIPVAALTVWAPTIPVP